MASPTCAPKPILVIDDNRIFCEAVSILLDRAGFQVQVAESGQQALALLRGGLSPCLILLDMMLPGLDGWSFLEQKRRNPALAAIPALIVTALGVASQDWATSLGAVGYLHKPFDEERLLEKIQQICRLPQADHD